MAQDLTTATTRAPRARPSCTAAMPLPPAAPSTTRLSPSIMRARSTNPVHAVMWGIQKPAASASVSPTGTGYTVASWARHSSAKDPVPR